MYKSIPVLLAMAAAMLVAAEVADYQIQVLDEPFEHPWSIAFLPDCAILVTERPGRLQIVTSEGLRPTPITGLPEGFASGQAGLFDVLLAMILPAGGLADPAQTDPLIDVLVPGTIKVHSTEEVMEVLLGHDYEWPVAIEGHTLIVPRIVINDLPMDWEQGLDVESRKSVFIRLLAPLILIANEQINADRTYILDALASGHGVELHDSDRYKMIASSYRLPADSAPLKVLKRVDIIPPGLAISQAILESGWGTSRFTAEGNALYGERTWDGGMEPMLRDTSLGDFGVRRFSSLLSSALSYMRNLNTSHHYQDFRMARMELRLLDKSLDACGLATHLSAYAALDNKIYRNLLCDLMIQNDLHKTDSAVLSSKPAVMLDFQIPETFTAMIAPVKDADMVNDEPELYRAVSRGTNAAYKLFDGIVRRAGNQLVVHLPNLAVVDMSWGKPLPGIEHKEKYGLQAVQVKQLFDSWSASVQEHSSVNDTE